jgi:hypothetical protein
MPAGGAARRTTPQPTVAELGMVVLDLWTLGKTRSDEADRIVAR